ncbi:Ff.00g124680.m01.CDS01 [Fusarium sp. VM40]|jgi:protein PET100|nr:Ff.00g124680.m01.CDS01 [Fusarium sp. VM40]
MGGLNLEVFKFGTYVMFPIGIMFYFGTNLDNRFAVPGFWPKPEECNKIPKDRDEIKAEYERIVARQKLRQAKKLEEERRRAAQQPDNNNNNDS